MKYIFNLKREIELISCLYHKLNHMLKISHRKIALKEESCYFFL
jgi:hypothetical protein